MKKALTKITGSMYYYENGERIEGVPEDISGNLSSITGNLNDCEITEEERNRGIAIKDLII
jgi:hypothetical protein